MTDQRVSIASQPTLPETDETAHAAESPAPRRRATQQHREDQHGRERRPLVDYFDRMRERGLLD